MKDWKERMEDVDPRAAAYFRCLGSAIAAEERQQAARIADALAGSTQAERDAKKKDWNDRADALEAQLRLRITRIKRL